MTRNYLQTCESVDWGRCLGVVKCSVFIWIQYPLTRVTVLLSDFCHIILLGQDKGHSLWQPDWPQHIRAHRSMGAVGTVFVWTQGCMEMQLQRLDLIFYHSLGKTVSHPLGLYYLGFLLSNYIIEYSNSTFFVYSLPIIF